MLEGDEEIKSDDKDILPEKSILDVLDEVSIVKQEVTYLKDFFVRRLQEDKQKQALINTLESAATNSYIKPFLQEIILLLDRLEMVEDGFVGTIYDELYDIIHVRGVERINVEMTFNPLLYKAVKIEESDTVTKETVAEVVRNGYQLNNQVLRPAEVIIKVPKKKIINENKKEI